MPLISIILSCYNGEKFLEQALDSILLQTFSNWEMIFVNDGSTDKSLTIIENYAERDKRIKIHSKENGGLNSARNFGLNFISKESHALIFSDADDLLHSDMLAKLYTALENEPLAGAAYCNYKLIDDHGNVIKRYNGNARYVPTKFWVRSLESDECFTPFVSIYTWTPMIEPLTMLKREFFLLYDKWDEVNFPKFTYGESIPLFGEISLNHNVIYLDEELYYYRQHGGQITKSGQNMEETLKKIDRIWENKVVQNPTYKLPYKKARIFRKYRLPFFVYLNGSFKHQLRYKPLLCIRNYITCLFKYLISLFFSLNENKVGKHA